MQTAPRETIVLARKCRQLHAKLLFSQENADSSTRNRCFSKKMETAPRETVVVVNWGVQSRTDPPRDAHRSPGKPSLENHLPEGCSRKCNFNIKNVTENDIFGPRQPRSTFEDSWRDRLYQENADSSTRNRCFSKKMQTAPRETVVLARKCRQLHAKPLF